MEKALWKRKLVNKLGLRQWQLYLLILPALVFLVLFCYLPIQSRPGRVWQSVGRLGKF